MKGVKYSFLILISILLTSLCRQDTDEPITLAKVDGGLVLLKQSPYSSGGFNIVHKGAIIASFVVGQNFYTTTIYVGHLPAGSMSVREGDDQISDVNRVIKIDNEWFMVSYGRDGQIDQMEQIVARKRI